MPRRVMQVHYPGIETKNAWEGQGVVATHAATQSGVSAKEPAGMLYVFDFDKTIISVGSERAIQACMISPLPYAIYKLAADRQYSSYCQQLFDHLLIDQKIPLAKLVESIKNLPLLPKMDVLLKRVCEAVQANHNSRLVILSGANDFYISTFLQKIQPPVQPTCTIISNKVEVVENQRLIYTAYQNEAPCNRCRDLICKGNALQMYMKKYGPFETTYYAGDGGNDVCPALTLTPTDVLFARKGMKLESLIQRGKIVVDAEVRSFETGADIEAYMKF